MYFLVLLYCSHVHLFHTFFPDGTSIVCCCCFVDFLSFLLSWMGGVSSVGCGCEGSQAVLIPVTNSKATPTFVFICTKDYPFVCEYIEDIVEAFNMKCVHSHYIILRTLVKKLLYLFSIVTAFSCSVIFDGSYPGTWQRDSG